MAQRKRMTEADKAAYPEWLEGKAARAAGKKKSENPYKDGTGVDALGMAYLWDSGWEAEKEADGSRFWCDKCRKPLYDAEYCGNCGQPGTT